MKKARGERFLKVRRREFYYLGCKGPDASAGAKWAGTMSNSETRRLDAKGWNYFVGRLENQTVWSFSYWWISGRSKLLNNSLQCWDCCKVLLLRLREDVVLSLFLSSSSILIRKDTLYRNTSFFRPQHAIWSGKIDAIDHASTLFANAGAPWCLVPQGKPSCYWVEQRDAGMIHNSTPPSHLWNHGCSEGAQCSHGTCTYCTKTSAKEYAFSYCLKSSFRHFPSFSLLLPPLDLADPEPSLTPVRLSNSPEQESLLAGQPTQLHAPLCGSILFLCSSWPNPKEDIGKFWAPLNLR